MDACSGKVVLLYSSYASNQIVEVNTRRLESVLLGKNVNYTKIDGAAPASKDLRSAMWEASGVRGYPQLFIDGKVIGGGTFDELQELIDEGKLDELVSPYMK
mmetsp:Transcript_21385/g.69016  ORF Transcript_21385/g.69016 Transcript_21385/m.69016 type:complete len:102 (-) Transcript_21385:718-1023(-)